MDAKKCDRCGKYFEVKGSSKQITFTRNACNFIRLIFKRKNNNNENNGFDLCNECFEELKKWMNMEAVDAEKIADEPHGTE